MRWLRRLFLFVVAVGTLSLGHVLVMVVQSNSALSGQREAFERRLLVPENLTLDAGQTYDCDQEYQSLLGLPSHLTQTCTPNTDCSKLTCKAFLFGNPANNSVYKQAKIFMDKHRRVRQPDAHFINITSDCERYRVQRGYHLDNLSQEEAEFPIAFNLLIHRDLEQVERLLRSIYRPSNAYCIHIDANSPQSMQDAVHAIAACFDNVFVASKLEHVVYAGFTRLKADINCMQDLVAHRIKWKYLMNLAGQSFPLMTNRELVHLFKIYNGMNDIEGMTKRVLHGRIDNEWQELAGKSINKTGRKNPKPPHDIDIVRGSAYGIFSREFVEFILTDKRAIDLLEWSKKTYSPDEHYWATLHHTWSNPHLHTPGGYSGYPDTKPWLAVYAAWGGVNKCHGMWKRGVCVFGVGDLPSLLTQKAAFANKFYVDYQPLALDCMDRWVEYKSRCPVPFNTQYYNSLAFVKTQWKLW